jgi:hypothetical protein
MGSMPLALSVHNFISSVGADAGFAAIIGLAILVLLYFAHARDTANLQREAEDLSHRLLQAETRLAQLSRQPQPVAQPAGAPAPAPAPATQAGRPLTGAPIRTARAGAMPLAGAPAGVGAPALAAATRVVPLASPSPSPAEPAAPVESEPAVEPADEPGFADHAEELAPAQGARAMAASAPVRERTAGSMAPSPATVAGAANGGGEGRVGAPPSPRPRPTSPSPPRERVPIRSGAAAAPRRPSGPPRGPAPRQDGGSGRRFALLVGALVAIAAIAALVIVTQNGGGSSSSKSRSASSSTTNAPSTRHHQTAAAFSPASVTVAVLNGTATNQLAHTVSAKLSSQGYKQGNVATASNQTQASTVVAYLPGARNDALQVATALKLGPASVQPIDSSTQSVACPPPSPCAANVVVTVGQDLATL